MQNPVVLVAIAEFDIDVGNTLSYLYPKNFDLKGKGLKKNEIADKCLPDGAHIHQEDWTILFMEWPSDDNQQQRGEGGKGGKMQKIYGMAMFKNRPDPTVKRGAIQKSMVAFAKLPIFDIMQAILREGVSRFIDSEQKGKKDESILKVIYTTINENYMQKEKVRIWDKEFSLTGDIIKEDEYPLSSLRALLKRFGADTMYIWYALLQEQRILFTGQPASEVAQCCLTCPLLVAPLRGFRDIIAPYVALTDLSKVLSKRYICGTTNALFETKTEWYDLLGSFSTGIVKTEQFKISTQDREFIVSVINGMEKNGENWTRQQFRNYTRAFLECIKNGSYKNPNHKRIFTEFSTSVLYEQYKTQQKPLDEGRLAAEKAIDAFRSLKTETELSDLGRIAKLWEILQNLVDLSTLDKVIDDDGIKVVAPLLDAQSAQVRKYAVQLLAQLAISMKGQIHMLQENVISKVVAMLDDDMANVANAACYCLYKICTLYIGVYSVIKEELHKKLFSIITKGSKSGDLLLKRTAAETLLQIYILQPDCEKVGVEELLEVIKREKDNPEVVTTLYRLLDAWGEVVIIPVSEETFQHIKALSLPHQQQQQQQPEAEDPRCIATSYLLSSMTHDPNVILEFVAGGGVEAVVRNANSTDPGEALGRLSYAVLSVIADITTGRKALLEHNAIEKALQILPRSTCPLYTYFILRFLSVCTQHANLAKSLVEVNGVAELVAKYLYFSNQTMLGTLCIPCIQAIKNLLLDHRSLLMGNNSNGSSTSRMEDLLPLRQKWQSAIYQPKTETDSSTPVNSLLEDVITLIDPSLVQKLTPSTKTQQLVRSETRRPRPVSMGITDEMLKKAFKDTNEKELSDEGEPEPEDGEDSSLESDSEEDAENNNTDNPLEDGDNPSDEADVEETETQEDAELHSTAASSGTGDATSPTTATVTTVTATATVTSASAPTPPSVVPTAGAGRAIASTAIGLKLGKLRKEVKVGGKVNDEETSGEIDVLEIQSPKDETKNEIN